MQKNPKISVIVPIYNAEKFIDRCIKSIYEQTFTDYEIILVNDGSKDRSSEICRGYAEKDSRVKFINKENGGAGSARNAGIEVSSGDYLAFPDVDDWFEPEMYKELYDIAVSGNYDMVFSGANYYSKDKNGNLQHTNSVNCKKISFSNAEECRKNVMTFFPTSTIFDVPWNKLYKRSVAIEKNVRFSDTRRCQDAMFNIDFYNASDSVAGIDKAYYNYIENDTSGVQRKFPKNYIDINMAYFGKLISILSSWGIYKGDIKRHYDTSFALAIYETMCMFENPVWNMNKQEQKEYIIGIMKRKDIKELLRNADIRDDAKEQYRIITDGDYKAFMRRYRLEKSKDKIRSNSILIGIYRKLKGN